MKPENQNPDEEWLASQLSILNNPLPRPANSEQAGKARFMAEAASLNKARASLPAPFFSIFKSWAAPAHSAVLAIIIAVVLIFTGGAASVYASQQSQPEQSLYPLKLLSEDVLLKLEKDPRTQTSLNLQFAGRRLDEINQQVLQGKSPDPAVIARLNAELNNAVEQAGSLENASQVKPAVENLEKNLENQVEQLTRLQSQANPRAAAEHARLVAMFQLRLKLAQQGIKDPQALHQLMEAQKEQIKGQATEAPDAETTPAAGPTREPQSSSVPGEDQGQNKGQDKPQYQKNNNGKGPSIEATPVPDQSSTAEPDQVQPTPAPESSPCDKKNGCYNNNDNGNSDKNNNGNNGKSSGGKNGNGKKGG